MARLEPIELVRAVLEIESRWYAQREHAFKCLEDAARAVGKNPNSAINARLKTKFDELTNERGIDAWISIEHKSYSESVTVKVTAREPKGTWDLKEKLREKFGQYQIQYVQGPADAWITSSANNWGSLLIAIEDSKARGNYQNDSKRMLDIIERLPELYRVHEKYAEKLRAVLKEFDQKFDSSGYYRLYGSGDRAYQYLIPSIYDIAIKDD